ncbi:hypothetical protein VTJ83DRAFT_2538 [Remersonia thermophila]|uniref:Zn(2)-C6 fungal-type domain-containing protein n=1 Tax=Remersonia thermophila TaxID=72144 RepID=A0ABR4DJ43_9PEZI
MFLHPDAKLVADAEHQTMDSYLVGAVAATAAAVAPPLSAASASSTSGSPSVSVSCDSPETATSCSTTSPMTSATTSSGGYLHQHQHHQPQHHQHQHYQPKQPPPNQHQPLNQPPNQQPAATAASTTTTTTTSTTTATPAAAGATVPSVPSACLACRGKHLKCDGTNPCARCIASGVECRYVPSRRGYKGPRRNTAANPHKRRASSSPDYAGPDDSCPMLLGHHHAGGLSSLGASPVDAMAAAAAAAAAAAFNPALVFPEQSPGSYSAASPMTNVSLFRNPYVAMMDPNALALTTTTTAGTTAAATTAAATASTTGAGSPALQTSVVPAPPVQPPGPTLAERCFDAFYHYFHAGHPFVLPRDHFLRLLKDGSASPNVGLVLAAMKYIGSLYVESAGPAKATYLDDALRLCYQPGVAHDGFLVQALLLLTIGLDGQCDQAKARELLADCERFAIDIGLHKRDFAVQRGRGNPVLEESWRRTWWDLYVCDGMIAGVHRITKFLLFDVDTDVGLPCEEQQYLSGRIPSPMYLEDMEDETFSDDEREFSSFAYRIAAIRNLGRMMRMPPVTFPDDPVVDRVQSLLTNWRIHLPDTKRDDLSKNCQLDEMMFQAHFITNACTIILHQPLSQLDTSPTQAVNSCAPHRPVPAGDGGFNAHTRHTLAAAAEISKMITQAVPITSHTHFFTCVITLSSIVHLSRWAQYMIDDEAHLRQQIRLNIGALRRLSRVWRAADTAWGQVKGVAQDIYRAKKAHQISPAFWVGFSQEQMINSINADEGIMSEFNAVQSVMGGGRIGSG